MALRPEDLEFLEEYPAGLLLEPEDEQVYPHRIVARSTDNSAEFIDGGEREFVALGNYGKNPLGISGVDRLHRERARHK